MSKFKVGDRVLCIDDVFNARSYKFGTVFPKMLETYTIRNTILEKNKKYGVMLKEIINPLFQYGETLREISFNEDRFVLIEPDVLTNERTEKKVSELEY